MPEPRPFPTVDPVFLKALKDRFPDRLPSKPDADLGVLIGEQNVIRFLQHQWDLQNNPQQETD